MKIKYLFAWEDNTWSAEIIDIPEDVGFTEDTLVEQDLVDWAKRNLLGQAQYRRAVLVAVYDTQPEGE